jgi:hypothetical protein
VPVRRFDLWSARSVYYLASSLAKQLGNGQDYHLILTQVPTLG